jgi:hypothetical protein
MTQKFSFALLSLLLLACHDEPTFVITFAPQDLTAAAATPRVDQAPSTTAAVTATDGGAAVAKTAPPPSTTPAIACKVAGDCAVAPVECCDCNSGGKQQLVAKTKLAAYEKDRASRCKGKVCVAMLSSDESCGMVAGCVDGKCALVTKK